MIQMAIRVIETTTAERKQQTQDLFEQCRPLMDDGLTLGKAVRQVTGLQHTAYYSRRWYKELKKYAESQGYQAW